MRAFLKNNRQAPRKVRLIARAVVGKKVSTALFELSMMPNKGAKTLEKLIASAVANATQKDANVTNDTLKVENITVDKGITYTRYMPRAFGRAAPIKRECSHIRVTLAPITQTAHSEEKTKEVKEKTTPVASKTTEKKDAPENEEKTKKGADSTQKVENATK